MIMDKQINLMNLSKICVTTCYSIVFTYMGMCACSVIQPCPTLTPWTVACQAPPPWGFSSQEYWSGLPCHPSGDLPNPGIKPRSPTLQAVSLLSKPPGKLYKHQKY